ncbi:MAG: hypothetical protein JXR37_20605 [Kiritimatiellae bacterium]|nr:hypothetical protein [Kiritimatiellia bacterium]
MRAKTLTDLLKKGDRIAVSNITGREASKVALTTQQYCGNIVAGWALGKAGQTLKTSNYGEIAVYGQFEELIKHLPRRKRPNKIVVYSPPEAVYGDVKEVIEYGSDCVETIYVITENVSIEVTAKLRRLCDLSGIDIVGCNTLGIINAHDRVRTGAVGGDAPEESFQPGSATVVSNSGNMVNTIASYLQSAGLGISFGISTGKDVLILTPPLEFLKLAAKDRRTRILVLYVEPGGTYERDAVAYLSRHRFRKPLLVYVAGSIAEGREISLGHAGAVVEGSGTSATEKMALFDAYFDAPVFDPDNVSAMRRILAEKRRGIRVRTLHDLVPAAITLMSALDVKRDFRPKRPLALNPWLVDLGPLARRLPRGLILHPGLIPSPYDTLVAQYVRSGLGRTPTRQPMRNTSHASSNDGTTPRVYGHSLLKIMDKRSFGEAVLLAWLGSPPSRGFEPKLFEMCLIASLTNGPGTLSAQGAKLSASAGNEPNAAMIATLSCIGTVHGGNGKLAARLLIDVFGETGMTDPYARAKAPDLDDLVRRYVAHFRKRKAAAKDAGLDYDRIPCLGHPVFNTEPVNYDPRERELNAYLEAHKLYNVFLDFYHRLSLELMKQGATNRAHAVNVDAAIACTCLAIAWPFLVDKTLTVERAVDLPFLTFALGRVAGGAAEYLDHRDCGTPMDMRIPVAECVYPGRKRD